MFIIPQCQCMIKNKNLHHNGNFISTALPTASVVVSGGGITSMERVFFDTGAQRTLISSNLAEQLKLPVLDTIMLKLTPFASETIDYPCKLVSAVIQLGKKESS